jgi:hypothetical protein
MVGIEEFRRVDIGADILDDDVRSVAPATDGDVAVGLCKTLQRGSIGAFDDFDARPHREGKCTGIDSLRSGKVGLQGRRNPGLAGS